jgi:hypothetical protein
MERKVGVDLPLLHKLYNNGKVTENVDREPNPNTPFIPYPGSLPNTPMLTLPGSV